MKINNNLVMMKVLPQDLPMPVLANAFYPFNPSLEDEMKRLFANFTVGPVTFSRPNPEDVMEEFRHNGRDYEYCPELETGVIPQPNPRRKKNKKPLPTECAFCKNNGEKPTFYRGHLLKDLDGRVSCPILRAYTCPICGACGDVAHTIKYCPANKNPEAIATVNALKALRNSIGKRRTKDVEGRVSCPILRSYMCQMCGDLAHTVKNCPVNKNSEAIATVNALKALENSMGKGRSK